MIWCWRNLDWLALKLACGGSVGVDRFSRERAESLGVWGESSTQDGIGVLHGQHQSVMGQVPKLVGHVAAILLRNDHGKSAIRAEVDSMLALRSWETLDRLHGRQRPHPDRAVAAAGDQGPAVGAEGQRGDVCGGQRPAQGFAAGNVPETDFAFWFLAPQGGPTPPPAEELPIRPQCTAGKPPG